MRVIKGLPSTFSMKPSASAVRRFGWVGIFRAASRLLKKQMTPALLFSSPHAGGPRTDWSDAALASSAAEHRPRRARVALAELVAGASYGLGREVSDAHQVVGGEGKRKHPVHAAGAPVPRLAHQPDRLEPAEDLLHAFAPALTHRVARMAGGPAVERAGAVRGVLRHVRGHAQQAGRGDEIARVVPLVGPARDAPSTLQGPAQLQRRRPLGVAAG